MPSTTAIARLLTPVISLASLATDSSTMFLPARGSLKANSLLVPGTRLLAADQVAVQEGLHLDRPVGRLRPLLDDAVAQALLLVDEAEARRVGDLDAAVELVRAAGDEPMHRRVEAERRRLVGDVVDLAVGDHDGAGDARRRHVAQRPRQRAEQRGRRAVGRIVAGLRLDRAHLELGIAGEALLDRRFGLVGLLRAVLDRLALAAVDDERDDALQRIALLLQDHRVEEREEQRGDGEDADHRAAHARGDQRQRQHHGRHRQDGDDGPGEERREVDRPGHWPSLSSSAGTCTWSAL